MDGYLHNFVYRLHNYAKKSDSKHQLFTMWLLKSVLHASFEWMTIFFINFPWGNLLKNVNPSEPKMCSDVPFQCQPPLSSKTFLFINVILQFWVSPVYVVRMRTITLLCAAFPALVSAWNALWPNSTPLMQVNRAKFWMDCTSEVGTVGIQAAVNV